MPYVSSCNSQFQNLVRPHSAVNRLGKWASDSQRIFSIFYTIPLSSGYPASTSLLQSFRKYYNLFIGRFMRNFSRIWLAKLLLRLVRKFHVTCAKLMRDFLLNLCSTYTTLFVNLCETYARLVRELCGTFAKPGGDMHKTFAISWET